jgi:large subunit ribosomal protein L22
MNEKKLIISATSKYIRISPTKIDPIIRKLRGKTYEEVLEIFKHLPEQGGSTGCIVWQTLYSAVSNAIHNANFTKENLMIYEAFVNQGPILKRMRPRAQGRAFAIEKKMAHVTIRVCEIENT